MMRMLVPLWLFLIPTIIGFGKEASGADSSWTTLSISVNVTNSNTATVTSTAPPETSWVSFSVTVDLDPPPVQPETVSSSSAITVGAYYYPWHKNHFGDGVEGYIRRELHPRHEIRLGEYDDTKPRVIQQHLSWSRQANINLWITSWWGQNSPEDETIQNVILSQIVTAKSDHKIALLYETWAWLQNIGDTGNMEPLRDDFVYICNNYVDHPNYYRINGRPVVLIYLTRLLEKHCGLQLVVDTIRQSCPNHNLYIIGDHWWGTAPRAMAKQNIPLDAITNYDMYGNMGRPRHADRRGVEDYYQRAHQWKQVANQAGIAFVPSVSPGYNDRGVRMHRNNPALSRRLTPDSPEGSLFEAQLQNVLSLSLVDPAADNLLLVNSFNEWHEDTQIEPVDGKSTAQDSSGTMAFTQGLEYIGYGTLYLDILARYTRPPSIPSTTRQHHTASAPEKSATPPIQFTGNPIAKGNLASLYILPNNFESGLRAKLGQHVELFHSNIPTTITTTVSKTSIASATPEALVEMDLWLSWQSNIRAWILQWYHPEHASNTAISELLGFPVIQNSTHQLLLIYYVTLRVQDNSSGDMSVIADDIQYLCDNILSQKPYFRTSTGRPVLILGLTRDLSVIMLELVVATIRQVAKDNGLDLFLLGDQIWGASPSTQSYAPFALLDGVTNLDVYGNMIMTWNISTPSQDGFLASQAQVDQFYEDQRLWRIAAWSQGCSFLPSVIPGYNDRVVKPEKSNPPLNPPLSRTLAGVESEEGSFLLASVDKAKHLLDSELGDLLVVNSFNQFQEDTQIFPVHGNPSDSPVILAGGLTYQSYGEVYLNLLTSEFGTYVEERVKTAPPSSFPTSTSVVAGIYDWCDGA